MLAQIALIVFALCAVLSLIIDIGYARITQVQMQNAADAAAIEGVRGRNAVSGEPNRAAARDLVMRVFDDDLEPTNGDPNQFGAGPIIDLTAGATRLHAHQTISVPDPHVYKPDLQLNPENVPYGDMVRGTFTSNPDPAPPEDQSYSRTDFTPDATGTAFLVRLRRSNEGSEQDVASSGSSLPLTFGKGTLIGGDDPSSTYSPRRDGLTVRATAIAATRPALRVGLQQLQANPPLPGVTPFALQDTCVQNANGNQVMIAVTIDPASGVITRSGAGTPTCQTGATVGRLTPLNNPNVLTAISTVGSPFAPPAVAVSCALASGYAQSQNAALGFTGYGPVYSLIAGTNRIIGFARISVTVNPCPAPVVPPAPATPFTAIILRGASAVAPSNATAKLMNGLPLPANSPPAVLTQLIQRNAAVTYGPVLVPVLAR